MKAILKVIQLYKNNTDLISKAKKSNREAQHMLYEQYAPKMLSVCRYYINDLQHAEDVMLQGFFKAFTHLNQFEDKGSFEGWLRKIMVRESISFLRQKKQLEFSLEESDYVVEYQNDIYDKINVAEIQELIDTLPEGYRIVFVMYAIEGYKHHEIAKMLDVTEGTSKSQLSKARKMLQKKLKELNSKNYGTN
jgi:RNA polymerase sigma-70 factor (ECF subfamily)